MAKEAKEATATPTILQPGQVVGHYEIVKPLGKGKFSIVYMAKRHTDGLMCALKKINIFDMMVPKQREKCMKEVRLLESLNHPNIVRFLESVVDTNELLIIVEWAEKGDLKRLIRRAIANEVHFKQSEIWEYSRQLASALDHMHSKRIMHRDLKPANIFVSKDAMLKLGDLGLGRFFSSQTLEAFSKVGTPLYMSPEVLKGAGYDMRSDVWSLGCVFYELAMLKSPFKSEQQLSLYDLFVRINKGEYPPLPDTFSLDFRNLVAAMLSLNPDERLHMSQVVDAVLAAQAQRQLSRAAAEKSAVGSEKHARTNEMSASRAAKPASSSNCRPSPLLVMDDIVEKLKLLECEELFLRPRGYPLLHRCFFVQPLPVVSSARSRFSQFEVMHELIRWLLTMLEARDAANASMPADASAGPSAASPVRQRASQPGAGDAGAGPCRARGATEIVRELVVDLEARNIPASSETSVSQLMQGHGEEVCLILNELINQELMRRDFHFEEAIWGEVQDPRDQHKGEAACVDEDAEVDSDLELNETGSAEASATAADSDSSGDCCVAVVEAPILGGGRAPHEQVHHSPLEAGAWKAEVERVLPILRQSLGGTDALSGWRYIVTRTAELSRQAADPQLVAGLLQGACVWRSAWHDECRTLQDHEQRINRAHAEDVAALAALRVASATQADTVAALQDRVSTLSEELAVSAQSLDRAKEDAAASCEALQDAEKLVNIRKAVQRIRDEDVQLEVRVALVQSELLARRKLG